MTFKDLPPGKYIAHIADWGVESVEKLGGLQQAVIQFDIKVTPMEIVRGRWTGFFETKDGKPNLNTAKTLVCCGFGSDNVLDLNEGDSLDNQTEYEVTITREAKTDGTGYTKIQWVNRPGSGAGIKKSTTGKKVGLGVKKALQDARKELGVPAQKKVKNFAPGAETFRVPATSGVSEEDIGF